MPPVQTDNSVSARVRSRVCALYSVELDFKARTRCTTASPVKEDCKICFDYDDPIMGQSVLYT